MSNILRATVDFYHRALFSEQTKAIDYLKSIGIDSKKCLDTFKVGYALGGINKLVPQDQLFLLREAGLIKKNGANTFKSAVVIPLYDLENNLVDIAGINLGQSGHIKTIGEKALGLANAKCLKATKDVIVTDYPTVALKLWCEDIRNVILAPDVHAMKMIEADKITILSYNHVDELVEAAQAKTVFVNKIPPKVKSMTVALNRAKQVRPEPIKIKPIEPSSILDQAAKDLTDLGYISQDWQKKLIYLIATSRLLESPLNGVVISSAGSGKSSIMTSVLKLMPKESQLLLSRLSPMSMYHAPEGFFEHKVMVIDEVAGSVGSEYALRTAMSEKRLSLQLPAKIKNGETGYKTINFKSAVLESSTNENSLNKENLSRQFIIRLDESPRSTALILEAQRRALMGLDLLADREAIIKRQLDFQGSLKAYPVFIPYCDKLKFPVDKPSMRREQTKFMGLVMASAILNQKDRVIQNGAVLADLSDYIEAYQLYQHIFAEAYREISNSATQLISYISENSIKELTVREVISWMGWSYGKSHSILVELAKYCYIEPNHSKRGRFKKVYHVLDYQKYTQSSAKLITPEELSVLYQPSLNQHSNNCQTTA